MRTALGIATLTFYVVLHFAASNDLLAKELNVAVESVTLAYQILLGVLPPLFAYLTFRLMKALALSGAERFTEMPIDALSLDGPRQRKR